MSGKDWSDKEVSVVTAQYRAAESAAKKFNPGEQPDIAALMRAAFTHGYAQALIDRDIEGQEPDMDAKIASETARIADTMARGRRLDAVESEALNQLRKESVVEKPCPTVGCTLPASHYGEHAWDIASEGQ